MQLHIIRPQMTTSLKKYKKSSEHPGDYFTNVSQALENNFVKIYNARNPIYSDKFKLGLEHTCII